MDDSKNNLIDTVNWWLNKKRPFIVNEEYKIELVLINKVNNTAKLKITNIKKEPLRSNDVK